MRKFRTWMVAFAVSLAASVAASACGGRNEAEAVQKAAEAVHGAADAAGTNAVGEDTAGTDVPEASAGETIAVGENIAGADTPEANIPGTDAPGTEFPAGALPVFSGEPYIEVNGNIPYFTEADFTVQSFETYSELDSLGRCGAAYANIGTDLMPTEERGAIGQVRPSGWHLVKYDIVDGKYLYNRCHLIGYQLAGENANVKNLITGTRYLNVRGMLPFENMVTDYVKETGNHVLYRVTPIFEGDNLVASGVLMEAESVEDAGEGIRYCVYVYNAQPGIEIDYATGESRETGEAPGSVSQPEKPQEVMYIINTNTKKFHDPACLSVSEMKESNRKSFAGSRDDLIAQGYEPCGRCKP